MTTPEVTFDDFLKVDIRKGTVVDAQPYPEAGEDLTPDNLGPCFH